ncbi:MAG: hypothetical protein ABEJ90_00370 [Halobacterium sp.]
MPEWSRRRTLQAVAAAGAAALAGCNQEPARTEEPHVQYGTPVEDYTARMVRTNDDDPVVWRSDDGAEEPEPSFLTYVTAKEDLSSMTFASDSAPAGELRSFVEATDYGTHSTFVNATPIRACFRNRLTGVRRERGGIEVSFCRTLRPADVACGRQEQHVVATAIRLPFPGDEAPGISVSVSGGCLEHPQPVFPEYGTDGGDGS